MQEFISLSQAQELVAGHVPRLPPKPFPLARLAGLVAAQELTAQVAAPSVTASQMDGYAVRAADLAQASEQHPVRLEVKGMVGAGEAPPAAVGPGHALRVTTGAPLPPGADAVLPNEYTRAEPGAVLCLASTQPGRNLLAAGADVASGQVVLRPGQRLWPGRVGLLAAAGLSEALAYPRPRVALLATGREVKAPGQPLPPGAVYASNLVSLAAWLSMHGLEHESRTADDVADQIAAAAGEMLAGCDALLTSGGAWTSERDLVVNALRGLGLDLIFRRVRLGPGKGVSFGLLSGKPVFCLPGGPPSNEAAFLLLALPGLLRLAGHPRPGLPLVPACLGQAVQGRVDWTQVLHGRLEPGRDLPTFQPLSYQGRLQSMARSQGLLLLPEGLRFLEAGARVMVLKLGLAFGED
ncbi:MAG: molybdopterin molybdenumtransferase MoeA [Desulfarculus sp.]|nr:MAG: molybdopterin molybdenumtransferase MoeA [Desulfarculus sp.]